MSTIKLKLKLTLFLMIKTNRFEKHVNQYHN